MYGVKERIKKAGGICPQLWRKEEREERGNKEQGKRESQKSKENEEYWSLHL